MTDLLSATQKLTVERRQHPRTPTDLPGRCALEGRREFACTVVDVSIASVAVSAHTLGASIGDSATVHTKQLGKVHGRIVRVWKGGFAIRLMMPDAELRQYVGKLRALQSPSSLLHWLRARVGRFLPF